MIKYLIILLCMFNFIHAITINQSFIDSEFKALSEKQKNIIMQSYKKGKELKIGSETYPLTIATFVALESGYGTIIDGDAGFSMGLTHFTLPTAKLVLKRAKKNSEKNLFENIHIEELLALSDEKLKEKIKYDHIFNLELCMYNFKDNYKKFKSYSKAVRAHNGFAPSRGFYNLKYYELFVNKMEVVRKVIEEKNI